MHDQPSYSCQAFHPSLSGGRSSGTLTIDSSGLQFNFGSNRLLIPLEGLELTIGGAADRLVYFKHPSFSEWSLYTSNKSVLKNETLQQAQSNTPDSPLFKQVKQQQRRRGLNAVAVGVFLLLILALPAALFLKMDFFTKIAARQIPQTWEQQLGESSLAQYQLSHDLMDQEQADELLRPLVQTLLAQQSTSYQFHFYIADQAEANAFALPGGYVVIHSGLILKADSPEQLIGVLAHEMAHVTEQHGVRNVLGSAGTYLLVSAIIGDASGVLATLAAATPLLLNQSYSRKFEREADLIAHQSLIKAKVDPKGLAEFFEKLLQEERKMLDKIEDEKGREILTRAMGFLSSHPASQKRIDYLNKLEIPTELEFQDLTKEFASLKLAVQNFVSQSEQQQNNKEKGSDENSN